MKLAAWERRGTARWRVIRFAWLTALACGCAWQGTPLIGGDATAQGDEAIDPDTYDPDGYDPDTYDHGSIDWDATDVAAPEVDCSGGMCRVPAGPFLMGCNEAVDAACNADEYPQHMVYVPDFEIDQYEVTYGEYGNETHCIQPGSQHPVSCVTWYEANAYCQSRDKRLCTEAEWEKAARGTDGRKWPWGNDSIGCSRAVYLGCNCGNNTCPAGSTGSNGASPYGVLDLCGNVVEWVQDTYHASYHGAPTDGTAWEGGPDDNRLMRGGGYGNHPSDSGNPMRPSFRAFSHEPYYQDSYVGFRCCR